jgi:uncharacterized protein (DUF58 family)
MKTTPASSEQQFQAVLQTFERFRLALSPSDQLAFDEIFALAHKHIVAMSYAAKPITWEIILLAMLLEEHKRVMQMELLCEKLG